MASGPVRGGGGRDPRRAEYVVAAGVALAAAIVYAAFQWSMPTQSGPDVAYYLLGCEHLAAGHWPWGAEPPLAFLVLYPWTRVLPPLQAFTACSAALGGLTVWLVALLAGKLGGRGSALLGALLCSGYMTVWFMTGLLKNEVVNVLLLAVLCALAAKVPRRAGFYLAMALAAHPGIAVTFCAALAAAIGLSSLQSHVCSGRRHEGARGGSAPLGTHRLAWWRRLPNSAPLTIVLAGAVAAMLLVAPTALRYLTTYLSADGSGDAAGIFDWDAVAVAARFLPLWLLAAMAVSRTRLAQAHALRQPEEATRAVLFTWAILLAAMASVAGLTSRRFEVQLFIPLVALAAPELARVASEATSAGRHRLPRRAAVVLVPLLGLVLAAAHIASAEPLLNAAQVAGLSSLADTLPTNARVVVALSDARYWVEYFARRPVLSPYLAVERLDSPGPLFLVSQDPTASDLAWPAETIADLRSRDALVLHGSGLFVARAEWNDAFFRQWRDPRENEAVLALAGIPAPPGALSGAHRPPLAGLVAGWLLFWPLGLARWALASPALAAAAGLPATVALWWLLAAVAERFRYHRLRRSPGSTVTAA